MKTSAKLRLPVLSTDECNTNQVSDSPDTFLDTFAILKQVWEKKF